MCFDGRNNGKEVGETLSEISRGCGRDGWWRGFALASVRRFCDSAFAAPSRGFAVPGRHRGASGAVEAGGATRAARHLSCTRNFNRSKEIWSISIPNDGCEARIPRASLLIFGMGLTRASLENHRRGFFVGPGRSSL